MFNLEMTDDVSALVFKNYVKLPPHTYIYQLEDGTVLYFKFTKTKRLYVKWQGKEIDAVLPEDVLGYFGVHGNAFFFTTSDKVFKALFKPPVITWSNRKKAKGEISLCGGFCSIRKTGPFVFRGFDERTFVYRMCDDPNRDGWLLDVTDVDTKDLTLTAIHRGKAIYFKKTVAWTPIYFTEISKTAIVVKHSDHLKIFAPPDHCHLVYFVSTEYLYTLDTNTMNFLPRLRLAGDDNINYIVGVQNRVITVVGEKGTDCYLATATLPPIYKTDRSTSQQPHNVDTAELQAGVNFTVIDGREYAKVTFNYEAQNKDELSLKVGQTVLVVNKRTTDSGWYEGEVDGRRGLFHSYFVSNIKQTGPMGQNDAASSSAGAVPRAAHGNKADVSLEFDSHFEEWQIAELENIRKRQEEARNKENEMRELRERLERLERASVVEQCAICLDAEPSIAFQCGHRACADCSRPLAICHSCRVPITQRIRLFS